MISCFTSLIPKLIDVEIAGDDCGFAGEPLRWGASYRLREKRKKGIYTEGHRDTEGTEKRERKNEERFLSARARLLRQREMLLDVLKVGLAVGEGRRGGLGCGDAE